METKWNQEKIFIKRFSVNALYRGFIHSIGLQDCSVPEARRLHPSMLNGGSRGLQRRTTVAVCDTDRGGT